MQTFEQILCEPTAMGNLFWNIQITMSPAMNFGMVKFSENGTFSARQFQWGMFPDQKIEGNWQFYDNMLAINYKNLLPNPNMMGQIVNWGQSTQNWSLRVTGYSPNRINAIALSCNGYSSNYSWFFTR